MKKKIIAVVLTIILVFSLSVTAMAVGGTEGPKGGAGTGGLSQTENGVMLAARNRIGDCLGTMTQNRAMVLENKEEHIQLATQLRTTLRALKESGATLTEDTLAALTALKTQLQTYRDELAATSGDVEALMVTYRELRQAGNLEAAAAILDQVIAVQQTRLQLQTTINALIQQMINLLTAI